MTITSRPTGVLLAGGLARRMGGGDKCLLPLAGQTLLSRSIERAQDQVEPLLLSANGNALRFARTKLTVVPDVFADFPGPMAGVHAAMDWMCRERPQCEWLASFACDTPFFPKDMCTQLQQASDSESKIIVATSNGRLQPVFALWHKSLLSELADTLQSGKIPWLQHWIAERPHTQVDFTCEPIDPFTNINTPQDLYAAEDLLAAHQTL
ncbi:molybdenum cofactor guanylyltransferase MobA [Gilvimarinus xylanilyticus]|uniref:Molybdenum cofactor guanylyltransferase n=1 Tax=Gilvimarinus xylanilyticus TaxID=2944139 RepID=A0A9X2KSG4_9GAMM|nr:molybdenum cofactor guanylyltransferase MobA [Gilvimarinus xylanilyticus]MCP8897793.1 molybdenum cofactor guanylyltransferase MobA [Gilvimarinus xylanilyticus]